MVALLLKILLGAAVSVASADTVFASSTGGYAVQKLTSQTICPPSDPTSSFIVTDWAKHPLTTKSSAVASEPAPIKITVAALP